MTWSCEGNFTQRNVSHLTLKQRFTTYTHVKKKLNQVFPFMQKLFQHKVCVRVCTALACVYNSTLLNMRSNVSLPVGKQVSAISCKVLDIFLFCILYLVKCFPYLPEYSWGLFSDCNIELNDNSDINANKDVMQAVLISAYSYLVIFCVCPNCFIY